MKLATAAACIICLVAIQPQARSEKGRDDLASSFDLQLQSQKYDYDAGEPVVLSLTLRYHGDQGILVVDSDNSVIEVKDSLGTVIVSKEPVQEPPPPPADWYVDVEGKRVLSEPLRDLRKNDKHSWTVPDALRAYHLGPGTYRVLAKTGVTAHSEGKAFSRNHAKAKRWAPASEAVERIVLTSNEIVIRIR